MRFFYNVTSPYTRIVRVALLETGLDARIRKQEVTLRDPTSALLPYNPVGRIPTLELDDGTVLTESLLILNYIDTLHAERPLLPRDGSDGWRTLAEMGTAMGMLEGVVTWRRELFRSDHERSAEVIALETTRVNRTADVLERMVAVGGYSGEISMPPASRSVALWAGSIRGTPLGAGEPAGRSWLRGSKP